MAGLEELAAALMGEQTQGIIRAENPYYRLQSVPQQIGDLTIKTIASNPGKVKTKDALMFGLLSGLGSGVLGGMGDNYQQTLTDRYAGAVKDSMLGNAPSEDGLSANLFGSATRAGNLFKVSQALEDRKLENATQAEIRKAAAKSFMEAKTPRQREQAMAAAQTLGLFGQQGAESSPIALPAVPTAGGDAQAAQAGESRGVEGSILDEVSREANNLMDQGFEPAQAAITSRQIYSEKKEQLGRQYKRVEEAQKAADTARTLADQIQSQLDEVGYTGTGGGMAQFGAKIAGALGNESQRKKKAAGENVETFAKDAIAQFGSVFKGPMSDRDVQIMLKGTPSLTNEPETNNDILNRWRFASEVQQRYVDFMYDAQEKGIPVAKAEKMWSDVRKKSPYVVKNGDKWEMNKSWIGQEAESGASGSWGGGSAVPAVGGSFNGQKVISVTKIR